MWSTPLSYSKVEKPTYISTYFERSSKTRFHIIDQGNTLSQKMYANNIDAHLVENNEKSCAMCHAFSTYCLTLAHIIQEWVIDVFISSIVQSSHWTVGIVTSTEREIAAF
jgi:hypothetical protein